MQHNIDQAERQRADAQRAGSMNEEQRQRMENDPLAPPMGEHNQFGQYPRASEHEQMRRAPQAQHDRPEAAGESIEQVDKTGIGARTSGDLGATRTDEQTAHRRDEMLRQERRREEEQRRETLARDTATHGRAGAAESGENLNADEPRREAERQARHVPGAAELQRRVDEDSVDRGTCDLAYHGRPYQQHVDELRKQHESERQHEHEHGEQPQHQQQQQPAPRDEPHRPQAHYEPQDSPFRRTEDASGADEGGAHRSPLGDASSDANARAAAGQGELPMASKPAAAREAQENQAREQRGVDSHVQQTTAVDK